ncbi:hypothetical protein GOBAR_AA29310 [Gossypium barbadense]|uniref:DUF4283 domain-containing protein n=1 Tax=Gossypium barbadense TaxID=3634 RepID=A0A2P5WJX5_GOSBA|nr:hypothetical protein GOBAR_AA29310 [Gossypium barbadense]
MRLTLANMWHPIGVVSISKLENERFMFQFYFEVDVDRVMKNGPWNYNFHMLILHQLKEGKNPLSVQLSAVDFWILINDLPHGFMSETVARQLGNFIRVLLEYDTSAVQMEYKGKMQVKVRVDLS